MKVEFVMGIGLMGCQRKQTFDVPEDYLDNEGNVDKNALDEWLQDWAHEKLNTSFRIIEDDSESDDS